MKFRQSILVFVAVMALAVAAVSCSGSGDSYTGFPCLLKGEKQWSIITSDGEIAVSEEFSHRPTLVCGDRFWAQNSKGYWELYRADDGMARLVTDREFRYVSYFHDGRAMVAERDKPVSIIDRDGNDILSLDRIDGKSPDSFTDITDGLAVFTADTLSGVVNFKGEVVIPPKYFSILPPASGRIIACDRNHVTFMIDMESDSASVPESVMDVYDYAGQKLFSIRSSRYQRTGLKFMDGYLPVATVKDGVESWGLMNADGEIALEPSKKIAGIESVCGQYFIYRDSEGLFGVKKVADGETVIKAVYTLAEFIDENRLAVTKTDLATAYEEPSLTVVNLEGERLSDRKFFFISPAFNGHLFCQTKEDRWIIADCDGNELEDVHSVITDVFFDTEAVPSYAVMSDAINLDKLLDGIDMSANGVDGMTFQSSVHQVLERQARYYSWSNKPVASNYAYTNEVNIFPTVEGEMVNIAAVFPSNLSQQTYRKEKVVDYVWGNYYYYHTNNVPTGYVFTKDSPSRFVVTFNNYGKLRGKLRSLYSMLVTRFSKYGSVVDSNSGATLIDMADGRKALVVLESNDVKVSWGRLPASECSISGFDGNKENAAGDFWDVETDGD